MKAEPTVEDSELKKMQEKCRRLQAEISKLNEENRQIQVGTESRALAEGIERAVMRVKLNDFRFLAGRRS